VVYTALAKILMPVHIFGQYRQ